MTETTAASRRPPAGALPARAMRVVVAALVIGLLPTFLVGALSVPIGEDLEVGTGAIGAAVSSFFIAASSLALLVGRVVDRIGARRGYRIGMLGLASAAGGIGLLAGEGWHLAVGFALAGASLSFVDPSIGRTIAGSVGWRRQGIGFGIKEAAVPTASMAAGLTLPLLGPVVGWQVPFLVVALLAVGLAALVPSDIESITAPTTRAAAVARDRRASVTARSDRAGGRAARRPVPPDEDPPEAPDGDLRSLALLAAASGLAGGVGAAVATFVVPTAQLLGLGATAAGVLLSGASVTSLAIRLGSGWFVDRRPQAVFDLLVGLLAAGAVGMLALALAAHAGPGPVAVDALAGEVAVTTTASGVGAGTIVLLVVGAVLVLGPGWGWTGLVFLTATRLVPRRPAQASGAILTGLGGGGALFPIGTGWLAERHGFGWTWTVVAMAMVTSVALMGVARARR